jgi:hypothetical protein
MGLISGIGVIAVKVGQSYIMPTVSHSFQAPLPGVFNCIRTTVSITGGNVPNLEGGICWSFAPPPGSPWTTPPTINDNKNVLVTTSNNTFYHDLYISENSHVKIRGYVKYGSLVAYGDGHFASWTWGWYGAPPTVDSFSTYMVPDPSGPDWWTDVYYSFYANSNGNSMGSWRVELIYMQFGYIEYLMDAREYGGSDYWISDYMVSNKGDTYFLRFYFAIAGQGWIHAYDSDLFVT